MAVEFNPVTFGEDHDGELYIGVQGWHPVYKIVASGGGSDFQIPNLLSETGAFSDLATLTPSAGVIPYDVIAPLWSDGAVKKRWLAIPNDGDHNLVSEQIQYDALEEWSFPVGTVLIKHFELALDEANPEDTRRLETRFLVKDTEGQYYAFTYRWNDQQSDAELLDQSLVEVFTITEVGGTTREQNWYYPSRSDCFVCHTGAAGSVLGPKSRQLNSNLFYPSTGLTGNQIESLNHIGVFEPVVDLSSLANLLKSYNIADETATLDQRARSYLDANCAGCHRPDGGPRSTFDLRLNVEDGESGIINGEVIDNLGIEGAKIVVPGDPYKSILFKRLSEVGTSTAMPPLAKNVLDEEAIELVRNWILSLAPLPVELVRFDGIYSKDMVYLNWETASESNNAGFAIERRSKRLNGGKEADWAELGFVIGQGTSDEKQVYTFTDDQLPTGVDFVEYRLKQIDFDGSFSYSNVTQIKVGGLDNLTLYGNYPNPFNPTTSIQYDLPVNGYVKLTVFDLQGKAVSVLVDDNQPAGRHEITFDASNLASGTYLYQLEVNGKQISKQMSLVK